MKFTRATKLSAHLGVEITGVNLAETLAFNVVDKLLEQLAEHHLLLIRNQNLNEDELISVSHIFGEPVPALVPTYRLENYPVITRHSNTIDPKKLPTGAVAPEYVFHADSYFTANPNKATLFYSLKSPKLGGETHFVNMCLAYDTLDESTKNLIADKKASYKNAYINQPAVSHPLVRVHPSTGKKALFVNIHRAIGVDGLGEEEALSLLDSLYNHATKPEFVYQHKWCNGDLLVWNNPTTMHCATSIDDTEERLLYRILTKGDLPVT
jgi:taurine dioxygenase